MKDDKKALGKGLSALISDATMQMIKNNIPHPVEKSDQLPTEYLVTIPINAIEPNADQPRKVIDDKELQELSESINQHGILQPLLVKKIHNKKYQIIAGERRWRAALRIGLITVPAIIKEINVNTMFEIAIIENVQREDLKPIEEATAYKKLIEEFGYTQDNLALKIGKSRVHITNMLRLLKLPETVHQMIQNNEISAGHARALITSDNPQALASKVVKENLSVRETEKMARASKKGITTTNITQPNTNIHEIDTVIDRFFAIDTNADNDLKYIENSISTELVAAVKILSTENQYYIIMKSDTMEMLDKILSLFNATHTR